MAAEERFVTRNPGFIQIPNDLWEARTEGGMEAYHDAEVYGWLWRFGHGSEHGYYGTVAKLAAVAHIKERHVRQSLRRLELAGFITRTERVGMTSLYRTHIEPTCAPRPITNPLPHGAPPASRGTPLPPAPQGTPPPASRGTPTPCPVRPPKQEPKNKNPENKKKPNSPQPAAAHDRGQDPEQSAKRKAKEPADPYGSKRLPEGAVPEDLMHLQQLLTDWWGVKPKGRTRKGFEQACRVLRKQPPEVQEEMLSKAIMGAYQGLHAPERRGSSSPSPTREQRREFMRRADQELKGRNIFELYAEQQAAKASAAAIVPVNVAAVS